MVVYRINGDDRVFLGGKTSSGKTYAANLLTDDIARLVAFDPKPSLRAWDLETVTSINHAAVRALRRGENRRIRIPPPNRNGIDYWIPWLNLLWDIGDVTGYIDEINLIVPPKRGAPVEFTRLYQQGRERGIGMWAATQRPVDIPRVCMTEAEWLFIFRLGSKSDRKRVADDGGDERLANPITDRHGVWIYNQTWQRARYVQSLSRRQVDSQTQGTRLTVAS